MLSIKLTLLAVLAALSANGFVIPVPEADQDSLRNQDYQRVDCYPEAPYSFGEDIRDKCLQRNCWFESSSTPNVPWCFYPTSSFGYTMTGQAEQTTTGLKINLRRLTTHRSPYPDPVDNLVLTVDFVNPKILNFKIRDQNKDRYEVPIEMNDVRSKDQSVKLEQASEFRFQYQNRPEDSVFSFQIIRKSTGAVLFDTSMGSFVYNDQFLQIATKLPTGSNVYGFGENNHPSLSHDYNYKTWGMFSRDQPNVAAENANQYGVQPFYNVLESDGNSHGVLFLNSNAMEYSFTPNPALILRSIGGIFDFYFFSGPGPEEVVKQYTGLVGFPMMIPYFSLGFQLSRWEYKDLNDMKRIIERNLKAGIPLDIQYADIEHYQNQMDFTIDRDKFKDLPQYFKDLQAQGMHVVIILDPALVMDRGNLNYKPYLTGVEQDIYIKWPKNMSPDFNETMSDIMLGYCWPDDKVAYPDFMNQRSEKWWIDLILEYRQANISFDALWIDMNEPAVFDTNEEKPWNWPEDKLPYWTLKCPVNRYDDPPYRTINAYRYDSPSKKARLSQNTLCMTGLQKEGKYLHYDVHSLYGHFEAIATQKATHLATQKRSFVLSRSTYIGSGRYAGHWLGDNDSSFKDLHRSIIGMIEFGLFGIPYVGADICGFTSDSNEELCHRWQQLGAFYPYSRNHNVRGTPDQDPAAWSQKLIDATKASLNIRYTVLPYYYTLFYKAHTTGSLVVRGLYQEFPYDKNCRTIDTQFLVGHAILVSPVVEAGKRTVYAYFAPKNNWYNYYDGSLEQSVGFTTLNAPLDYVNVHIRGGYVIPTQKPANNTSFSRKNPFGLIVALDEFGKAKGDLFYDDGDSLDSIEAKKYYLAEFEYTENNQLTMKIKNNNYAGMQSLKLDTIRLMGLANGKSNVKISAQVVKNSNGRAQQLNIDNIILSPSGEVKLTDLDLDMTEEFTINFKVSVTLSPVNSDPVEIYDVRKRVDCHPEPGSSESSCRNRQCSWYPTDVPNMPWCFIDQKRVGYAIDNDFFVINEVNEAQQRSKTTHQIKKVDTFTYYGEDIRTLRVAVELKGANAARVKLYDPYNERYEVPVETSWSDSIKPSDGKLADNDLDVRVESDSLGRFVFEVYRKSTGTRLISTRDYAEAYIFSDRFIQLYTRLASENVYGFGESSHTSFRHKFQDGAPAYPIWARDEPPSGVVQALYGTHPFYMLVEDDGKAYGFLILNSNAQEYKFSSLKTFAYRTLGGILDMYIFSGPTPEDVIKQYTSLIGKPQLPPYHALGFQISRYGYDTLANMKAAVDRTVNANIPLDIIHGDIDHFEKQKDFTYDLVAFNGLPQYVDELKSKGIRFITILDPALVVNDNYGPYVRGDQLDVWIKWPADVNPQALETKNRNMLGYVWPEEKVLFPDFFQNNTVDWWSNEIKLYYDNTLKFSGLWIDMNEPANFGTNQDKPFNWPANQEPWSLKCPNNRWDDPPYRTNAAYGDRLSDKTLCLVGEQKDKYGLKTFKHYDVHNLYGHTETLATYEAMLRTRPGKRPLVITRSTFPGSGAKAGHWLGDNTSAWPHLKYNIIGLLEFNLFGIPYVGADTCGFFNDADEELCERWMQLGAFNPFYRNHNSIKHKDQDPGSFSPPAVESMRKAVELRYTLLPHLYTLFYKVNTEGGTVARSLVHEFPRDRFTRDVDEQFMWGSSLLISPVIYPGRTVIDAYFPRQARWFDFYNGKEVNALTTTKLTAPRDVIPVHIRGGHIIPLQQSAMNTDLSRKKPFELLIAPDEKNRANGTMYYDDGESLNSVESKAYNLYEFTYANNNDINASVEIRLLNAGYQMERTNRLANIRISDVGKAPKSFQLDLQNKFIESKYDAETRTLTLSNLNLELMNDHIISIIF